MSEGKGKWGYLVASAFVSSLIGYFAPKMLDAVIPWLSENPLSQYPMETIGIAVAASLIGFLAGSKFGKTRVAKPRKLTLEEIEAEKAEVNEKNRKTLMRLNADWKTFLKGAIEKKAVYCRTDEWQEKICMNEEYYEQFVEWEHIEGNRTRIRPTAKLETVAADNSDLFDAISVSTINDHAVYDPSDNAVYNLHSSGDRLDWWWYSHDPEVDYRKMLERASVVSKKEHEMRVNLEHERMLRMLNGFSKTKAKAVIKAFEAGEFVDVADFENEVMASIQNNEGIFLREAWIYRGISVPGKKYGITDEWRAFLRNPSDLIRLEELTKGR